MPYNVLASERVASRNFLKFTSVVVVTRKKGQILEKKAQIWGREAITSNEFVAVVTFSRQYILIGFYSHMMFYVAHMLLLRIHYRKALRHSRR